MLLDRLLARIVVRVEPFALCLLDSGWRLRLPGPSKLMFHFGLEGRGTLLGPRGERYAMEPYQLGIIPIGAVHALECGPDVHDERVIRKPAAGEVIARLIAGTSEANDLRVACGLVEVELGDSLGLFSRLHEVVVIDLSAFPQVREAFQAMMAEQANPSPGSEALVEAYMNQCLVYLLRKLSTDADCPLPWLLALADTELAPALDVIFEEPARSHTVESLADRVSMSRSTFAERFHAAFGCAPMTFLRDVRLRQAAVLLKGSPDAGIDQIAHKVGFSSRSHFSQAFRTRFGVAPAMYRAGEPARSA